KDHIVSPIQTLIVRGEPPMDPVKLVLGPGTRVYGTATRTGNQSGPSGTMRLLWRDAESYAKLPADQLLPNPKAESRPLVYGLALDAPGNSDGQFEFYVPPGKYALSSMYRANAVPIVVTDQKEIKVDFQSTDSRPGLDAAASRPQPAPAQLVELSG